MVIMEEIRLRVRRLLILAKHGCVFSIYDRITGEEAPIIYPDLFMSVKHFPSQDKSQIQFREIGLELDDAQNISWARTRRFQFDWLGEPMATIVPDPQGVVFSNNQYDLVVRPIRTLEEKARWQRWLTEKGQYLQGDLLEQWKSSIKHWGS